MDKSPHKGAKILYVTEPRTAETTAIYDSIAIDYEQKSFDLDASQDLPRFIELIPAGGKVLDAGCGYGRELKYFIDNGFDSSGIDMSSGMLELARKRAPEAKISHMNITQLQFPDETFDGVWCRGALHHLNREQVPAVLQGLKRVLKPNGALFVMCREGEGQAIRKEELSGGLERTFTQFRKEELEELVKNAGFDALESYQYNEVERYGQGREDSNFVVVIGKKSPNGISLKQF